MQHRLELSTQAFRLVKQTKFQNRHAVLRYTFRQSPKQGPSSTLQQSAMLLYSERMRQILRLLKSQTKPFSSASSLQYSELSPLGQEVLAYPPMTWLLVAQITKRVSSQPCRLFSRLWLLIESLQMSQVPIIRRFSSDWIKAITQLSCGGSGRNPQSRRPVSSFDSTDTPEEESTFSNLTEALWGESMSTQGAARSMVCSVCTSAKLRPSRSFSCQDLISRSIERSNWSSRRQRAALSMPALAANSWLGADAHFLRAVTAAGVSLENQSCRKWAAAGGHSSWSESIIWLSFQARQDSNTLLNLAKQSAVVRLKAWLWPFCSSSLALSRAFMLWIEMQLMTPQCSCLFRHSRLAQMAGLRLHRGLQQMNSRGCRWSPQVSLSAGDQGSRCRQARGLPSPRDGTTFMKFAYSNIGYSFNQLEAFQFPSTYELTAIMIDSRYIFEGAFSFGKGKRSSLLDHSASTPGPGNYDPLVPKETPKWTLLGKPKEHQAHVTPSPGQYQAPSFICKKAKIDQNKEKQKKSIFGSAKQEADVRDFLPLSNPSPGLAKSFGDKPLRCSFEFNNFPGPGQYNSLNQAFKPGGSFGKSKRVVTIEDQPGPGSYNLQLSMQSKSGHSFSKALKPQVEQKVIGPGEYKVVLSSGPSYSLGRKYEQLSSSLAANPGPGEYDLPTSKIRTPLRIMSPKSKSRLMKLEQKSPFGYEIQRFPSPSKNQTLFMSYSKRSIDNSTAANSPGPGSYNLKSTLNDRTFKIHNLRHPKLDKSNPGPGDYSPSYSRVYADSNRGTFAAGKSLTRSSLVKDQQCSRNHQNENSGWEPREQAGCSFTRSSKLQDQHSECDTGFMNLSTIGHLPSYMSRRVSKSKLA